MSVRTINNAVRRLDWNVLRDLLLVDNDNDDQPFIELCTASVSDWNRYVRSPRQALNPKYMEWRDGRIWIVEFPGSIHGSAAGAFSASMALAGTGIDHLSHHSDSTTDDPPPGMENELLIQPDCSFGPYSTVGGVLPPGLRRWRQYSTVKVDFGVCEGWGGLDRKSALWRRYPGVEYVVSIKLSPKLRTRECRFEERVNGQFPGNDDPNRAPILPIGQNTVLQFDAHRLLGLPENDDIPVGFNDPVLINVSPLIERIHQESELLPVGGPRPRPAGGHQRRVRPGLA
ncbi:hypothetical protein GN958_ATG00903 [Phytophthora infestans]|uniref:Uncharacterized protein n=1 Tax=Phytophthora infestans TaxID=4787 RepID=A0A8S9VES4_PHYIN|nr:hypothetical protein GN958_ATG00903 [Phytophthora infestans]